MKDDLLVKYLAGETDEDEKATVIQWMETNAENERYFRHLKLIWEKSDEVAYKSNVDVNVAWDRFKKRIILRQKSGNRVSTLPSWIRIAALFLLICTAGAIGVSKYFSSKTVQFVHLNSRQQILSKTLPDGSIVTLNRNSTLSYPSRFKGAQRNISMQGEAFFNVSADKGHPFIVRINKVTVTVVGTSFNIKSRKGKTEVIVESGIVDVHKNNDYVQLVAGEKVIASQEDSFIKGMNSSTFYKSYKNRRFVCRNTPLYELVGAINDTYDVHIVIETKDLEMLKINTTFSNASLDDILHVVSETFNIQVEHRGNTIILK
ncbi:FecR family protein [Arcticibacter eurypsychrophilus]|uniref:FecR family protein n=1 Tax=Arcticibacter eurypsychrophilus TaxID=1434752 RepID=UPI00084D5CBB|nr:FecR domain-containing protein [Arcticibacter eurypsychrophilus]